jgi:hypothetical protein
VGGRENRRCRQGLQGVDPVEGSSVALLSSAAGKKLMLFL